MLDVGVLYLHSSTFVTSSRVRRTPWGRRRRFEAGDTDSKGRELCFKIAWFDCYDLNGRGRMEIYHVLCQELWLTAPPPTSIPTSNKLTKRLTGVFTGCLFNSQ